MKRLRMYLGSLVEPMLGAGRSYQVEYASGVMPHSMASRDVPLHLLADMVRDGWLDVTVPRVFVHEAVKVELT